MALFGKNSNESAYVGGQKHWSDVIKNSGPGELLIWRQPEEDFNTNSTLIVMPGEEAIFIKGGAIEQTFTEGTYRLSTENYPVISRLRNLFTGGVSTFSAVVYFVRKAHSREILWGTSSPIQVRDKLLGIATKLRARGAYKIQIENPQKFLTKLLGNNIPFEGQQELLDDYFANEFQGKIKSSITRALNETQTELLGIEARIEEFAEAVQPFLGEVFDDYGLKIIKFSIAALDVDDDELRRRYDSIGMDAIAKMRNAQADKGVMNVLGEDWGRQQAANILGTVAANPGAGGVAAAGAGIGMGVAAGGMFAGMAQQMFAPMQPQAAPPVAPQPTGRFTQKSASGAAPATGSSDDPVAALKKLKDMLDLGLIERAEFDTKKSEILGRM
ncbi:membrane protease family stomatin/prohibitin-like protein [Planctomycetales bacterium]|nr:membrane protease family stomatin/prohibitin-like protein [Planctomycetales bacterium]GHT05310.1 membrane protease family stomatin/prohibitin-like protein [Planctomycetales bacterium]